MVRHSVSTRIVRECDSPQLVGDDRFSFFVLDLSHECPGYRIEGIDRASVSVVRYQQRIPRNSSHACNTADGDHRSRVQGEMAAENVNLSDWNFLAVSKQGCEGETIRRWYRRHLRLRRRDRRMTYALRRSVDLQVALRQRS